jgi:hypothetical protein
MPALHSRASRNDRLLCGLLRTPAQGLCCINCESWSEGARIGSCSSVGAFQLRSFCFAFKQVIRPTRGFQTMKSATATIKGFEIMRMIRRGHCLTCKRGAKDEVRFVNSLFGVAA